MKDLNNKIRNSIANSQHLKQLAKDDRLSRGKSRELYDRALENDKKIIFLKAMSNAIRKIENEEKSQHIKK